MNELELFIKMIEAMEGLDVNFKIGKESELVIKGDFMKIAKAFGTMMQAQSDSSKTIREIDKLNNDVIRLKSKA